MKRIVLIILIIITGCNPDEIGPQSAEDTDPSSIGGRKIYIVNEGNFGRGGSSISVYRPVDQSYHPGVFSGANQGAVIGDVAQNMLRYQDQYFISVNASGYVLSVDTTSFMVLDTIAGDIKAPVHLALYENNGKAELYISDLYERKIWLADPQSAALTGAIDLPAKAAHLINCKEQLFFTVGDDIGVIDGGSYAFHTISLPHKQPDRMVLDDDCNVWALFRNGQQAANLVMIDQNEQIKKDWQLPNGENPRLLAISSDRRFLYYVSDDGVYRQRTGTAQLTPKRIYALSDENVYSFRVDPRTDELYFSDAIDFDQASDIYRIDSSGQVIDVFKGGIITGDYFFGGK